MRTKKAPKAPRKAQQLQAPSEPSSTDAASLILADAGATLWECSFDAEGEVLVEIRGQQRLRLRPKQLIDTVAKWAAHCHPEDRAAISKHLQGLRNGSKKSALCDYRYRNAAGEWLWRRAYARALGPDSEGTVRRIVGLDIDISEQRTVERALRESEERYRLLVENQGEGIGIVDEEESFTFANPAACEILGVPPGSLEGRNLREFIPEKEFSQVLAQTACRRLGERSTYELTFQRPTGELRLMLLTATPQYYPDGVTYRGAFGIFRDITERREAEERRIAIERRLEQASRMESIGRLAGGIAHDFNNLLTPILSNTEFLLEEILPGDPMREELLAIEAAASRARDLTRRLMALGQAQPLATGVIDINEIVSSSYELLRRLIPEDISFELALDPALGHAKADPSQVQQILMNLCLNARDAIQGEGLIRVLTSTEQPHLELDPGEQECRFVRLTVQDNGCGLDAETQKRIFEPFFSTKDKDKGTGLGLATVHSIVKQLGGQVVVESVPGHGASFHVFLRQTEEMPQGVESSIPTPDVVPGGRTVLVVEDDDAVRLHVCLMLQRRGFRVLEAREGFEALRRARSYSGRVDLLLTDVVMPRMNGRELAEELSKTHPNTRVIFMSGYAEDIASASGSLDSTRVLFLQKPFTSSALRALVEAALADKNHTDS